MKGTILNRQTKDRHEDIIMMLISVHLSPLNNQFNGCRTIESLSSETQLLGQSHTTFFEYVFLIYCKVTLMLVDQKRSL